MTCIPVGRRGPDVIPAQLHLRCRPRRVVVLLVGIVVLSLADLIITLTHLTTVGMAEANPVARWVIQWTGSPVSLVLFKVATVGVCVVLLYRVRHHLQGEIAAWLALVILAGMSVMWFSYTAVYENPVDATVAQEMLVHGNWVRFK